MLNLIEGVVIQGKISPVNVELEIHRVARMGDEKQMRNILKYKKKSANELDILGSGRSALHEAAARGHLALLKNLLDEDGIDINQKSYLGKETPLHLAVFSNHRIIVFALLNRGADANRKNNRGQTPLYYVQKKSIASLLCSHGALTTTKDIKNQTPLESIVASIYPKDKDLVDYLVKTNESRIKKLIQQEIQAKRKDRKKREIKIYRENEMVERVKEAKIGKTRMKDYKKWRKCL